MPSHQLMAAIQADLDRRPASRPCLEEQIDQLKYRLDNSVDSNARLKNQLDAVEVENAELEHIAYNALAELEKHGGAAFLMLKDETIRKWWSKNKDV